MTLFGKKKDIKKYPCLDMIVVQGKEVDISIKAISETFFK